MPRALPARRMPRHRLVLHRPARPRDPAGARPPRTSDLVLALLGVVMLGGFALAAAFVLTAGATAP